MSVLVVTDERFLDHRPGRRHPERPARLEAVWSGLKSAGLEDALVYRESRPAADEDLLRCHPSDHLAALVEIDAAGGGLVDTDTVMSPGSWSVARLAAGAGLVAVAALRAGEADVAFCAVRPPGHHATPNKSMGFCLVNNLAIAAMSLVEAGDRVAIVDIDAHHGDGVYYAFEEDPDLAIADIHEDGRYLYPGSGAANEEGKGIARGTKLNIPLPPNSDDNDFFRAWPRVEALIENHKPEFIIFQAGVDSMIGDPLTHLRFSVAAHTHAAKRLVQLANKYAKGRLLVYGGGGYNLDNVARGWCAVCKELI